MLNLTTQTPAKRGHAAPFLRILLGLFYVLPAFRSKNNVFWNAVPKEIQTKTYYFKSTFISPTAGGFQAWRNKLVSRLDKNISRRAHWKHFFGIKTQGGLSFFFFWVAFLLRSRHLRCPNTERTHRYKWPLLWFMSHIYRWCKWQACCFSGSLVPAIFLELHTHLGAFIMRRTRTLKCRVLILLSFLATLCTLYDMPLILYCTWWTSSVQNLSGSRHCLSGACVVWKPSTTYETD